MYIIGECDLDLSRGCCSCPLKTGGKFCGRLDHDMVKTIAMNGGIVDSFVPQYVAKELYSRYLNK